MTYQTVESEAFNSVYLPVVETFHSLQGEGAWTGVSAFFIRLAGCDVGCTWCDTKESWNPKRHQQRNLAKLQKEAKEKASCIVVITGGEPLIHDLNPLTSSLRAAGLRVHLETSGAHPFSGSFDWVTLSPKMAKPPQKSVYPHVSELKVVVVNSLDLEWAQQQSAKVTTSALKYLQPEWNTHVASQSLIVEYVKGHPEWRLSLQTHNFLGVR